MALPAILAAIAGVASSGMSMAESGLNIWNLFDQKRREDSALQRRIHDARAAGINPIYAASGSATSSPVSFKSGVPGALQDAVTKAAAISLQAKQEELIGSQKNLVGSQESLANAQRAKVEDESLIMSPQVLNARNQLSVLRNILNSREGEAYTADVKRTMMGEARNEARLYGMADKYNVPVSMLGSVPGQALMMNELFSTASPEMRRKLVGWVAAMNAGNITSKVR